MSEARQTDVNLTSRPRIYVKRESVLSPLLSGSAAYLVSNILIAAIPFALLPILTRYLTPLEYGRVAMFQTLLGGLGAFVGVGIAAAGARKHYDQEVTPEAQRLFTGACLQVLLISALLVLATVAIVREPLSSFLGLDTRWVFCGVAVTAAGVLVQIRLAEWQVRRRAFTYGMFQVGQSLFNMVLSLVLVVAMTLGSDGRIGAQSAAAGFFGLLAMTLLWRDGLVRFTAWRPAFLKEIVSYGLPLIPHVLAAFVLFSIDRVVIKSELGLGDAGVYMVAVQLASGVSLVFDAISRAYMPWLFDHLKRNDEEQNRQVVRTTYAWFGMILLGAVAVFVIGPRLVVLVAGEQYARAGSVIGWLVLGQSFLGMYLLLSSYLMFSKRTGLLSFVTVWSALVYIALLLVLVPRFGLNGAATGFAAAMGLRLLFTWWAAHRTHPMPWLSFGARR